MRERGGRRKKTKYKTITVGMRISTEKDEKKKKRRKY